MFSCVGQIFSKGYKIHIHGFFFSQPLVCVWSRGPEQRITQQHNYLHEGFPPTRCWGSVCLFSLSEFAIILLNKILRNIN